MSSIKLIDSNELKFSFFFCLDLYHESNILSIKNVTRNDPSKYECVASNGILPSVSKKFQLTVYCIIFSILLLLLL